MKKGTEIVSGTLEDQISKLPEELLVRIVSLLPTEDAAKTCLVSKRWEYLWTSIDNLSFCYTTNNFVGLVEHVLAKRTPSNIRKFHLDLGDAWAEEAEWYVILWLSNALKHKVENLVLKFGPMYKFPPLFYTCSSLVTLDLCKCAFDEGVVMSWKSLKKLKLASVELDNETMAKLLSACPALETMELSLTHGLDSYTYALECLRISNSNLKRLKLHNISSQYIEYSLDIFAPYLEHLEVSGEICNYKLRLLNVSSLISASLNFDKRCCYWYLVDHCRDLHIDLGTLVHDYLRKLAHVTELTVGTWLTEVIFMLQLDGVQLPELKCKLLTLEFHITKYNLHGVASLLRASPHVETLNIKLEAEVSCARCPYESSYLQKGDGIDLDSWIPNIAFPSLKSVKIICPIKMPEKEHDDKLFELSEFLLKNAMALEKFVITGKRKSPYASELGLKLLGFPRPSTKIMMIFRESNSPSECN